MLLVLVTMIFFLFYAGINQTVESPESAASVCSFSVFRQTANYSSSGYLRGDGTWRRNSKGQPSRFYPALCNLVYGVNIPSEMVTTCLLRQNVRYIAVLGDSNGLRYFSALHWHLSQTRGVDCTPIARSSVINWAGEGDTSYVVHRCQCGPTVSGQCVIHFVEQLQHSFAHTRCRVKNSKTGSSLSVAIEFVTVIHTIDWTNMTRLAGCQRGSQEPVIPTTSDTFHRFLLAEFFADPVPDLFIVFGNAHDRMPLRQLSSDIDAFAEMIDRYIRAPTRLIFLSKFAEDVTRKPKYWRELRYEYGTMTRLEWLDAANRIMYKKMRRRFLDTGRLLLFPDLLQMSQPVLADFNVDGVHMKREWYRHVMSYILQTLCTAAYSRPKVEAPSKVQNDRKITKI